MTDKTLNIQNLKAKIDVRETVICLHQLYETYISLQLKSEAKKVNAVIADLDLCTRQDTAKLYAQRDLFDNAYMEKEN